MNDEHTHTQHAAASTPRFQDDAPTPDPQPTTPTQEPSTPALLPPKPAKPAKQLRCVSKAAALQKRLEAEMDAEIEKAYQAQEQKRQDRIRQLTHPEQQRCDVIPRRPEGDRGISDGHVNDSPTPKQDDSASANDPSVSPPLSASVLKTKMGTPVSPRWSEDWIELVNETEERVGHRCCGAHAPDDLPCELESTHENGRCRFHGGAPNSGAQKGNANAQLHGLYSKRLQQCGTHCSKWKNCPHGGKDVEALPPEKRPYCPYEVEELEALRELNRSAHEGYVPLEDRPLEELERAPYPVYAQLLMQRENLNMLQVMISRAARMLSAKGFETETLRQTDDKFESVPKMSPVFQAYTILEREFRLAMRTYNQTIEQYGMPKYEMP